MRNTSLAAVLAIAGWPAACGGGNSRQQQAPAGPPPVGYVVVAEQPVTLTTELPGRTTAYETSDVRPQVNGLITARLFQEGDMVRAGPAALPDRPRALSGAGRPMRAPRWPGRRPAIASSAALARRYGELVKINAIARQDYENAHDGRAARRSADVAAQQAALQTAQINLAAPRSARRSPAGSAARCSPPARWSPRPDRSADHDPAARPDLRRHPAVERRPAAAAPAVLARAGRARRQRAASS